MPKIVVHAGDFGKGKGALSFGAVLSLPKAKPGAIFFPNENIQISELQTVETASEEAVKRLGGTVGWGIAGAALLGPVGLLAGLIAGGKGKDVTFVAVFKDGRRLLATTDSKTFNKLQAAVF